MIAPVIKEGGEGGRGGEGGEKEKKTTTNKSILEFTPRKAAWLYTRIYL